MRAAPLSPLVAVISMRALAAPVLAETDARLAPPERRGALASALTDVEAESTGARTPLEKARIEKPRGVALEREAARRRGEIGQLSALEAEGRAGTKTGGADA